MTDATSITVRRMHFEDAGNGDVSAQWLKENPLIAAFFCALSGTFPDGERFFIDSVRHYQSDIRAEDLLQRVRAFIGQEAHHGKSHQEFNDGLEAAGLPIASIAKSSLDNLNLARRKLSPARQLAITVALEHVTATFAGHLLSNSDQLDEMPQAFRDMLVWHAVEEIEHKSVAFDVYRDCVGREGLRIRVQLITLGIFFSRMLWYQRRILKATKTSYTLAQWWRACRFYWGARGLMLHSIVPFIQAMRPGFHPDDIDQRPLITDWQARFPEVAAAQH